MKRYWFLIILFAFCFLQTTVVPLNLLIIALSAWAFCRTLRELLIFSWFSGLLFDFLSANPIGSGAFFFLVFVTVLFFLRQKFINASFGPSLKSVFPLLSAAVFFGEIIWQVFVSFLTSSALVFPWINIFSGVIFALLFFPLVSYFSLRWQENEQLELRF